MPALLQASNIMNIRDYWTSNDKEISHGLFWGSVLALKYLSQDRWYPHKDFIQALPKCRLGALLFKPICLVVYINNNR
jgi:hypothetical protein